MRDTFWFPVAGPDLQIREGPGHLDPEISGGLVSKQFFTALRASVWSNKKKGADNCGILKFQDLACRNLKFKDLTCRILKFQNLTCRILKFQYLACRILKFQNLTCKTIEISIFCGQNIETSRDK